ncbi:MAG: peptidoglycan bridge formation glycyltransferase FemA/FemB family protein [Bulleidia sp.]
MAYIFHTDTDPAKMDAFVMSSDQNTLFQCSKWASIKDNWDHCFYSVTEDDRIVASALALIRALPLGKTLMYIPRGPVMDWDNQELVTFMLDHIKAEAKKRKAITVRFDPAVHSRKYAYVDRKNDIPMEHEDTVSFLISYGAKHKGYTKLIEETTQPRFNAEMDVIPDYMKKLQTKTRSRIRKSAEKGITIYEGPEYVHDFAVAMHYTEVRKQIALRNEEYFSHMLDVYGDHAICMVAKLNFPKQISSLEKEIAEMTEEMNSESLSRKRAKAIAEKLPEKQKELNQLKEEYGREGKDEVITSGCLAVYNDSLMELFYTGNNPDYMRTFSSYYLWSKYLDRCITLGIPSVSFGGIEGTLDDGLTQFKSNWIMNVEEYIGEFNIILDPLMYTAFDSIYPSLLKLAAKMKGRK